MTEKDSEKMMIGVFAVESILWSLPILIYNTEKLALHSY
jgi:hypothetical protein